MIVRWGRHHLGERRDRHRHRYRCGERDSRSTGGIAAACRSRIVHGTCGSGGGGRRRRNQGPSLTIMLFHLAYRSDRPPSSRQSHPPSNSPPFDGSTAHRWRRGVHLPRQPLRSGSGILLVELSILDEHLEWWGARLGTVGVVDVVVVGVDGGRGVDVVGISELAVSGRCGRCWRVAMISGGNDGGEGGRMRRTAAMGSMSFFLGTAAVALVGRMGAVREGGRLAVVGGIMSPLWSSSFDVDPSHDVMGRGPFLLSWDHLLM